MTEIDFIFDFGSPNAYLAHKLVPGIEARTGASFRYIPCLLGGIFKATGNQPPMAAFGGIKNKLAYEMLEMQRFVARHDIVFQMNPDFPINTLLVMRGAIAAETNGNSADYVDAVFDCMWAQPRKMDDPEIVLAALNDAGLDGAAMLERTSEPAIKAKLIENTDAAVSRGVFGAPTFFVDDQMWFGKDRLRDIEEFVTSSAST